MDKESYLDHPFPVKEYDLLMRMNEENLLTMEDINLISKLLYKYMNLRAEVFHEF